MHTKKLFVLKDVAYGVKDGSSAGTASSINLSNANYENLEDGAFGIFLLNTDGKPDLVTDTGASGTGQQDASGVTDKSLCLLFRQGTATAGEEITSGGIPINAIRRVERKAYTAPTKGIVYIGYDGTTTGKLNLPTIALNDEAIVASMEKKQQDNNLYDTKRYNAVLTASQTAYSILAQMADIINNTNSVLLFNQIQVADIISDGTLTTPTGTPGNMTLTKGSTTVTFASAVWTNATTGDYLAVHNLPNSGNNASTTVTNVTGIVYKITAATATTYTLDRPYTGETQVISQTNQTTNGWAKKVTVAGELGLRLVDKDFFKNYKYAVGGVFSDATINRTLGGSSWGVGAGSLVVDMEIDLLFYRTMVSQKFETGLDKGTRFASSATNYDIITVEFETQTSVEWNKTSNLSQIVIAVPNAAGSTNTVAAKFGDIIKDIFDATGFNVPAVVGF